MYNFWWKSMTLEWKNWGIFKLDNKFSEDLLCIVFLQCMFAFFLFFNLNTVFLSQQQHYKTFLFSSKIWRDRSNSSVNQGAGNSNRHQVVWWKECPCLALKGTLLFICNEEYVLKSPQWKWMFLNAIFQYQVVKCCWALSVICVNECITIPVCEINIWLNV